MGRYATREEEIDRMLRRRLFVDLYQIVRHAIRASVESYSTKELERFFWLRAHDEARGCESGPGERTDLARVKDVEATTVELKETVAGYNRDDCVSARGPPGLVGASAGRSYGAEGPYRPAGACNGRSKRGPKRLASTNREAGQSIDRGRPGGRSRAQRGAAGAFDIGAYAGVSRTPANDGTRKCRQVRSEAGTAERRAARTARPIEKLPLPSTHAFGVLSIRPM
jgi:hypothetical protein